MRDALGARAAAEITPQELERWMRSHCGADATANRYKAFLSLAYREGIRNGKVVANPARLIRQRKEPGDRLRFLSIDEYDKLLSAVERRFPQHASEFIVSVHSGMRLSEQYSCRWSWFDAKQQTISLPKTITKNGQPRTVHLNADALRAIEAVREPGTKETDPIFPRQGRQGRFDTRSWFDHASKRRKSRTTYGTETATPSAAGWPWRALLLRRSREPRAI